MSPRRQQLVTEPHPFQRGTKKDEGAALCRYCLMTFTAGPHDEVGILRAEAKRLREAEQRVRELHAKFVCGCGDDHGYGCKECRNSEYPCPTVRALEGREGQ